MLWVLIWFSFSSGFGWFRFSRFFGCCFTVSGFGWFLERDCCVFSIFGIVVCKC